MSLQFNDDYVRVPIRDKHGELDDSENDLRGFIEEPVRSASPPTDTTSSIWNFKFYQHLFDVDTQQVSFKIFVSLNASLLPTYACSQKRKRRTVPGSVVEQIVPTRASHYVCIPLTFVTTRASLLLGSV
ncbi:hypothetical protein FBUS_00064 [Fasciolopsis buskii]|uniref:Uncharacterized protein n=1 Tax=Fasciolopsis buskii TaxID=27845 RepID=A0A8E0VGE0_9TREM|nr:hypothetical protein FBUS_00064 [Fasciolopsis buski]